MRSFLRHGLLATSIALPLGACSFLFGTEPTATGNDAGELDGIDGSVVDADIDPNAPTPVAEYHFDEVFNEAGRVWIRDSSPSEPALDMAFRTGDHLLVELACEEGRVFLEFPAQLEIDLGTPIAPAALLERCGATSELTVEVWFASSDAAQTGPARILTLAPGTSTEAILLGQDGTDSSVRIRGDQRAASFESPANIAEDQLTFMAVTAANGAIEVWRDTLIIDTNDYAGGFSNWSALDGLRLNVANVAGGGRPWAGKLHYAAIYCEKLGADVIENHASTGPPEDSLEAREKVCAP